ncbi:MAG: glycerol-3-phosphate acyltransferase [Anaerolineaceae bacterium]|nr:glycerol-3-phosphate acyltransferase [Anaerolineaceae bacterium]
MLWLLYVLIAFLCGSIPFSVWLGKLFVKKDVRQFGDGNPGAANTFKTGNKFLGLVVLLLDISKAAIPVGLAYHNLEVRGIPMVLIALAPTLGHAFSPFLKFKGGKALATVLGVWIGLTIWKASLASLVGVLIGIGLLTVTGWAVMLGMLTILASLLIWLPDPIFLWVWLGQVLILVWTHRLDLKKPIHLRPRFARLFSRSKNETL